jgi:transglutaminase/protease-like cytokinesis protein 3
MALPSYDFSRIDQIAANLHYQGTNIPELASQLSLHAKTEIEKARIIYTWLAYHIAYDVEAYLSGNYGDLSPQGVLSSRRAVCSGYANLYQALAQEMKLEASIISGYAKGIDYAVGRELDVNHAWNGVRIDGGWYLVDATWGAGTVGDRQFKQKFNPHYFATPPEQFIYDHLPVDKAWQMLSNPLSQEQFASLPAVSSQFFKSGLSTSNYTTSTISAVEKVDVVLNAPQNVLASADLVDIRTNELLGDGHVLVQKRDGKIIVTATFPRQGNYDLRIFSNDGSQGDRNYNAITYRIKATGSGGRLPKTSGLFLRNHAYLYSPLSNQLNQGQTTRFALEVPQALDVQVIDTASNTWTQLTKVNGYFIGDVVINSGKVHVSAKFAGNDQYWTLVEYNQ